MTRRTTGTATKRKAAKRPQARATPRRPKPLTAPQNPALARLVSQLDEEIATLQRARTAVEDVSELDLPDASDEPPEAIGHAATFAELDEIEQRLEEDGDDLPPEVVDDVVRRLRRILAEMR
jgi:hypothetical protein